MKRILPLILIGILAGVSGCHDKSDVFTLTGRITHLTDSTVTLYGIFSDPDSVITLPVKEGRVECSLPMEGATPLYLYIGSLQQEVPLFADKGLEIKIKGDTAQAMREWQITGGALQQEFADFTDSIRHLNTLQEIRAEADSFIIAHPRSLVSLYLIDTYFVKTAQMDKEAAERVIAHLSGVMHDHPYIARLQERLKEWKPKNGTRGLTLTSLSDSTGTRLKSSDYKEKFTVLVYWASWHPESRQMLDSLKQTMDKFAKRPVEFVSISLDSNRAQWLNAVREDTLPGTHVCDLEGWNSKFMQTSGVTSLPALQVLNTSNRVVISNQWGAKLENSLDKQVTDWEKVQKLTKKKK